MKARSIPLTRIAVAAFLVLAIAVNFILFQSDAPEEGDEASAWNRIDPKDLITADLANPPALAPDIPVSKIPDYKVAGFTYNSANAGIRQWKLEAEEANMYNKDELVHARTVRANLFNPGSLPTIITAKEAKYFLNRKELEVFGDVVTRFPDGFVIRSEYLKYYPNSRDIQITEKFNVQGEGKEGTDRDVNFRSQGFRYDMAKNEILLPKKVFYKMTRHVMDPVTLREKKELTIIQSDYAAISRTRKVARFDMDESRPLKQRLVIIEQPNTFIQSRWAEIFYEDTPDSVHYMIAHKDVYILETEKNKQSRWATCGQADFSKKENIILLRQQPQVYQGGDTVTGDLIRIYRDTDVVEVDRSNAYSEGKQEETQKEKTSEHSKHPKSH